MSLVKLAVDACKRMALRLVLGRRTYEYMCGSLKADRRLRSCRMVDIVVRKDGIEKRVEADWLKTLCRIVERDKTPGFMSRDEFEALALEGLRQLPLSDSPKVEP